MYVVRRFFICWNCCVVGCSWDFTAEQKCIIVVLVTVVNVTRSHMVFVKVLVQPFFHQRCLMASVDYYYYYYYGYYCWHAAKMAELIEMPFGLWTWMG